MCVDSGYLSRLDASIVALVVQTFSFVLEKRQRRPEGAMRARASCRGCSESDGFKNRIVCNCIEGVFKSVHRTLLLKCLQATAACIPVATSLQMAWANLSGSSGMSVTAKVLSEGLQGRDTRLLCPLLGRRCRPSNLGPCPQ